MGKGRAPTSAEWYTINKNEKNRSRYENFRRRVQKYADEKGISIDEAYSQIAYMGEHGGSLSGYRSFI